MRRGAYEDAAELLQELPPGDMALYFDDSIPHAPEAAGEFMRYALFYPDIAKRTIMIESPRWEIAEAALKCLPGKALVNAGEVKNMDAVTIRRLARRYGAVPEF
jgi:cobalamin-dependent methionine synthase I